MEYANNELLRITGDVHLCPASALLFQRLQLPARIWILGFLQPSYTVIAEL